jgi:diaminopimelate epimerase
MSGSGNDFIFFDARSDPAGELASPGRVAELCARGTGVGADGIVFVEPSTRADFAIRYFNADGSLASLCGNASLCSTRLAVRLGVADGTRMTFETGAGVLHGRIRGGLPEIDLSPVETVRPDASNLEPPSPGERRIGFAVAGVPHVVLACDDVAAVDVQGRGPVLRWHPTLPDGANVNWVSRHERGWAIRTFERGVEGETLACGTGAAAAAILLAEWGLTPRSGVALETASGRQLEVSLTEEAGRWRPSLRGEGRIVFEGRLGEV